MVGERFEQGFGGNSDWLWREKFCGGFENLQMFRGSRGKVASTSDLKRRTHLQVERALLRLFSKGGGCIKS